jgi:uncharacterized membrane protein (Fun14 family)
MFRSGIIDVLMPKLDFSIYEAEVATLSGQAYLAQDHTGYSGTGFVAGFINTTSAELSFSVYVPSTGSYQITLHYSAGAGDSTNTGLTVNGSYIGTITCASTSNWDTWSNVVLTVTLNAGSNTIVFNAASSSAACTNFDYIKVPVACKYEAESAALSGGAALATNHTGYSGAGFVDGFISNTTAQVLFTISVAVTGSYQITLRYAANLGTSTNTGLYVNTTKIKNITCNNLSSWNTWDDEVEIVTLNAGSNTIAYKADVSATACINLDYILVQFL